MKKQIIMMFAAVGLLMSSCVGKPEPKTLEEIPNADLNDSIGHYWGQLLSSRYWQMTKQDSELATEASKDAYLEGFQTVINLAKNDNNAFNMGMYSAIEAMLGMVQANADFNIDIDREAMLLALAYGMQSDTIVDYATVDAKMRDITMRLQKEKEARERVEADSIIASKMKTDGYDKDLKGNAYKNLQVGEGAKIESNDQILAEISFGKIDGTPLFPSMGASKLVVDQNQYPLIINEILKDMNIGTTRVYLLVATDVFGANVPRQLGVKSSDVVILTIKVVGYCDEEGKPTEKATKAMPVVE